VKITDIRFVELEGVLEYEGELWESRNCSPIQIYPEFRGGNAGYTPKTPEGDYLISGVFVEVDTDEGVTGRAGPTHSGTAQLIAQHLRPRAMGEDALAHERLWDRCYRSTTPGRKSPVIEAISILDCALWDLKGKWFDQPVYKLLGGPTRETIPAYASTVGCSLEPAKVRERAQAIVAEGYTAMKWFFLHGPGSGREGMAENLELVRTVRESVGDDVDIMFDAWLSWDVPYAIAMGERMAEYRPRWLEEPVSPDRIDSCAAIRRALPFPIASGEHEYTRWGHRDLIEAGAVDVLQPDIYWVGGITETVKICTLASVSEPQLVPHVHSVPATVHLLFSQPPDVCPLLEYLLRWNVVNQFFLKNPIEPRNGEVALPEGPGMGMELDEEKITSRRELEL
jgi:L-rhamnonate dehydratase